MVTSGDRFQTLGTSPSSGFGRTVDVEEMPIPDISTDRLGWFRYFDDDDSGTLDKDETVRAILKTMNHGPGDLNRIQEVRNQVGLV